jgi:hypothetical protein
MTGRDLNGYPLFVILDILGNLYFAPDFSDFDYYESTYHPGENDVIVLPEFTWPEGAGNFDGALWYAGLTNPEMTELFGSYDVFQFGWEEP